MAVFALVALVAAALSPAPLRPVSPIAPMASAVPTKLIEGFRSARFRTTPSQVRRAIQADFPGLPIAERDQPTEGTKILQISVPSLDPGPGPGVVSYVFGATSHTLALVSVRWATRSEATPDDRQAIAVAALRLSTFLRSAAQPRTIFVPRVIRPGVVSLYGALDDAGAGIELTASGIAYASKDVSAPPPSGSAALQLSYMVNPANPDIRPQPAK